MKKYMKGLFLLALPLVAFLVSCSEDDAKYEPAQKPTNQQVYFPVPDLPTTLNLPLNDTKDTIQLMRQNTEGELTVKLITEQSDESSTQISVPETVTFADGENTVDVIITYDPETTNYDDKNQVTISIADESITTPYGSSSYKFTAVKPAPYTSLGMGLFCDRFFYDPEDGSPFVPVEILKNEGDPYTFRLVKPTLGLLPFGQEWGYGVGGEMSDYLEITIVPSGSSYATSSMTLTSTDDLEYVYFKEDYATGILDPELGHVYLVCPLWFDYNMDYNKVVSYQEPDEDGNILPAEIDLAPFHLNIKYSGYVTNEIEGIVRILFPGYEPKDYTANLTYAGILTAPGGEIFACGDLKLGADAENVKAIVMPEDADPEAVADAIAAGDLEAVSVEAGRIEVPFDTETLEGEQFQIIVVVIDDEDAVQAVATSNFEYFGGGATPWESLGVGYYSDGVLPSIFDFSEDFEVIPSSTYEVEILGRSDKPGLYRLVNAYNFGVNPYLSEGEGGADGDFIEVNATDPEGVYITLQNTHVDFGYGEILFQSAGSYYLDNDPEYTIEQGKADGEFGTLVDGNITFPVLSYDYDGETYYFQGVANMGSYKGLDVGSEDCPIKIVLPSASGSVKAKAAARVRASQFEQRLNGSLSIRAHKNKSLQKNRNLFARIQDLPQRK